MRTKNNKTDIHSQIKESLSGISNHNLKNNNNLKQQEIGIKIKSMQKKIQQLSDELELLLKERTTYSNEMELLEREVPRSKDTQNRLNILWSKRTECQLKIVRIENILPSLKKKLEDWEDKYEDIKK